MANDPTADLAKKVAELEMNVRSARTETQGLMAALVVAVSALDAIHPTLKRDVMDRLQKLADSHRRSQQGDLAGALERLMREM